ncbi:MAG: ATP-binding cassette domain-containing protein [Parachlamydia sp.]|nr:ATP-binding cassette domain-containing protein [Parachlamydia sp.]
MSLVTVDHLSRKFDQQIALDDINVSIPKGKIVALAGPDGAGKTTLIRLIAGLLLPTEGTITVAGLDTVRQAEQIHAIVGYMPQKFGLYEDLTVMENLLLYADLQGVLGEERQNVFKRLLDFTNLEPFQTRLAGDLSGGMKQKLGLACTLLRKPALLLLDEPSVGVDPISRRELWNMVYELLAEDISVIWSTAYLDEAEKCDIALLLNEGKLLYQGPPQDLTKRLAGRTFKITQIKENRRHILADVLNLEGVIDGIIQGSDVRFVTRQGASPPDLATLQAGPEAKIIPTPPRFEDAFIDILGGGPGGTSALSALMPKREGLKDKIIDAEGLTKRFGSFTAASDITFQVKSGEIFGLLGPNGAGKSTTFKMLCGLLQPSEGRAFVNQINLQEAPGEARAQIGYMAQKFSLYGDLSVLQNLEFFSGAYNLMGSKRRQIIDQMVSTFSFKPYLDSSASELPLGFKQRLALSCAVMHHPEVLFLDEPTSGVDPITRREFWNHINGLVEKGVTVMVTTHFMDEAENCDRIALVYQSKIITIGTPDDLKRQAVTPDNPSPTLEDAFIYLIEHYDKTR